MRCDPDFLEHKGYHLYDIFTEKKYIEICNTVTDLVEKNLKWVWKKKTSIRCQHDAESQLEYITRSADAKLL